jgi:hypothetical protein
VLYLAVRNLVDYRGRNVGVRSSGWKQALPAFTIYFDGRIPTPIDAGTFEGHPEGVDGSAIGR